MSQTQFPSICSSFGVANHSDSWSTNFEASLAYQEKYQPRLMVAISTQKRDQSLYTSNVVISRYGGVRPGIYGIYFKIIFHEFWGNSIIDAYISWEVLAWCIYHQLGNPPLKTSSLLVVPSNLYVFWSLMVFSTPCCLTLIEQDESLMYTDHIQKAGCGSAEHQDIRQDHVADNEGTSCCTSNPGKVGNLFAKG